MDGIVTLLDSDLNQRVESIWHVLEAECDLVGIKITPIPHFSWHVAQSYHLEKLRPVLQGIASATRPYTARTAGLGIFSGEKTVIYISMVKTEALLRLHQLIWEFSLDIASGTNHLYQPNSWIPHITLAQTTPLAPVDTLRLNCAMSKLAFQSYDWQIAVDNIALISQAGGAVAEERIYYRFGG